MGALMSQDGDFVLCLKGDGQLVEERFTLEQSSVDAGASEGSSLGIP